jgi:hypothetical protein
LHRRLQTDRLDKRSGLRQVAPAQDDDDFMRIIDIMKPVAETSNLANHICEARLERPTQPQPVAPHLF